MYLQQLSVVLGVYAAVTSAALKVEAWSDSNCAGGNTYIGTKEQKGYTCFEGFGGNSIMGNGLFDADGFCEYYTYSGSNCGGSVVTFGDNGCHNLPFASFGIKCGAL